MPSTSKSQQRLFCMAYAVRTGKLKRSEVNQSVLDIVDGDMTDKQIKDFMIRECSLSEWLNESLYGANYSNGGNVTFREESWCFMVIKPEFLNRSQEILQKITDSGLVIDKIKTKTLTKPEARRLYLVHKDKDFYKPLVEYMCSGMSTGLILKFRDSGDTRDILKVAGEIKEYFREKYEVSKRKNVMHSTDTKDRLEKEAACYF